MEKSFRDILQSYLIDKRALDTEPSTGNAFDSSPLESPLWRPEVASTATPFHSTSYQSYMPKKRPAHKVESPKPPPAPPAPEKSFPLAKLGIQELACVKILTSLGAENLTQDLKLSVLKREHRRLAKRYHPDRQSRNGDPQLLKRASEAFLSLSDAYEILVDFLTRQT